MQNNKLKHIALRDWIKDRISDSTFKYGDKLLSENELAAQFGISRQTVRQAIGALEAEGVLTRVRGSGTYVAALPVAEKQKTMNIGVITTYLDDYIFPPILNGIDSVLLENGYTMNLSITNNKIENEAKVLRNLIEKGVDGLIVEGTKSAFPNPNTYIYKEIRRKNLPCIFINSFYSGLNFPYIALNDVKAAEICTDYLVKNGHRKIGGIFKSDDIQGHLRYSGYCNELKKHGIDIDERNVMWFVTEDLNELFAGDYDKSIDRRLGCCSAVVCYNDQIAVRLIDTLKRLGKNVPDDISIISFDNSNFASFSNAALTSVNHPKKQRGIDAAQHMISMLQNDNYDWKLLYEPILIERNSVKTISHP